MSTTGDQDLAPPAAAMRPTERLDGVIAVTRTRVWMALAALAVTVAGLAAWASVAEVAVTEEVLAVAIPGGAFTEIVAPADGVLLEYPIAPGSIVDVGDVVAVVDTADGEQQVTAPIAGTVMNQVAGVGVAVSSADRIALLEQLGTPTLRAFIPIDEIQQVDVGDEVAISFEELESTVGPVDGTVSAVAPLPLDLADVALSVGDEALAKLLFGDAETVAEVSLEVASDVDLTALRDDRPEGAPPFVAASVTIVLDRESPLEFILP